MGKIRVLQIITLSEMGGAQKVVYHIAAGLEPGFFDVTVACAPGGELVRWLREPAAEGEGATSREECSAPGLTGAGGAGVAGGTGGPAGRGDEPVPKGGHPVRVVELPELRRNISPLADLRAFWQLYRLIRRERFDIVHCHSSKAGVLGRLAARLAGAPRIYFTAHGWGINQYQGLPARLLYTWAERLAGAVSTGVVCVSQSDLAKALRLRLAARDRLRVIYNGLPEPRRRPGVLRRELGLDNKDMIVGMVARLAPPKEPVFFLDLARRLLKGRPQSGPVSVAGRIVEPVANKSLAKRLFFVIVGDGLLFGPCEEFVREHGLSGRVFLLGAREDAAALVQDFDVFALFSRWEGLPLTVIEAMLAGVPVVANAVGGVGELVVDGETGILIKEMDLEAAERALVRLLSDGKLRRRLGEAGRRRARQKFSLEEMLLRYRELYLEG